jgi:hypothetical protein
MNTAPLLLGSPYTADKAQIHNKQHVPIDSESRFNDECCLF